MVERTGAEVVREAAVKTGDLAGDGTTTATVLARAIVREGVKAIAAGMNPMDLKRGIDQAVEAVVADLKARSQTVSGHDKIAQVGTIIGADVCLTPSTRKAPKNQTNKGVPSAGMTL